MNTKTIILAGGCFWCIEHDMRKASGVSSVVSGYTGGSEATANYIKVASRTTGHREAVLVTYHSDKTNFKKLCQFFLDHIDPTDDGGQFYDRGEDYQTVIYFETDEERTITIELLKELDESHLYDKPVVVRMERRKPFYKAEEEHQNYAEKKPEHYEQYRKGSGREDFVNRTCMIREEKHMQWKD